MYFLVMYIHIYQDKEKLKRKLKIWVNLWVEGRGWDKTEIEKYVWAISMLNFLDEMTDLQIIFLYNLKYVIYIISFCVCQILYQHIIKNINLSDFI